MIRKSHDHSRPPRSYECATCGRKTAYHGSLPALYPFCSQRCKFVDLGKWLHEEYTIDRDITPEDLPDQPDR